jgi:hemerythrin
MEHARCPAHALNKKAHAAYRYIFANYRRQCAAEGLDMELLRKLHATASLWIQEHILKIDTRLRPCIKAAREFGV